jgi:predicted permease
VVLFVVVCLFLAGWASTTRFSVPPAWLRWADLYVVNIALPAVILAKVSQVDVTSKSVTPIFVAWSAMTVCAIAVVAFGQFLNWPKERIGALLLVGVLGNTSYLGIEAVRTLIGDSAVAAAVTYDQMGTFLALSLYGSWVAGRFGSAEKGWRPVVRRLSRFTPFLALLLSLALRSFDFPDVVLSSLNGLGLTVAPVAMGVLGMRFSFRWSNHMKWVVVSTLLVKMIAVPVAVFLASILVGDVHGAEWSASILQSAAPPMVTAGIVAITAGLDEAVVVAVVGVGTLVSFVTLPLFALIL